MKSGTCTALCACMMSTKVLQEPHLLTPQPQPWQAWHLLNPKPQPWQAWHLLAMEPYLFSTLLLHAACSQAKASAWRQVGCYCHGRAARQSEQSSAGGGPPHCGLLQRTASIHAARPGTILLLPACYSLPACLPAYLPACLPTCLPACLPACLLRPAMACNGLL